jgi:hypothetical protein
MLAVANNTSPAGERQFSRASLITYQLGWQSRAELLNVRLLRYPFPFALQDLLFTIFAFTMMLFLVRRFSLARTGGRTPLE